MGVQERDSSSVLLPPRVFEQKYGWKNEPQRGRLMAEGARKDDTITSTVTVIPGRLYYSADA
jgi:hypothetical protein